MMMRLADKVVLVVVVLAAAASALAKVAVLRILEEYTYVNTYILQYRSAFFRFVLPVAPLG